MKGAFRIEAYDRRKVNKEKGGEGKGGRGYKGNMRSEAEVHVCIQ